VTADGDGEILTRDLFGSAGREPTRTVADDGYRPDA
jgi:hypothetical protein